MEQSILIIISLTLIGVLTFIFLYLATEKKKKATSETEFSELKELFSEIKTKIIDISNKVVESLDTHSKGLTERFEGLGKEVRTAQDQANQKINSGFEQLQTENSIVQKDVKEKVGDIKNAFNEYSLKVQESLTKYSNDNAEFEKNSLLVKEQIQRELQGILKEIKSPLDLD